MHMQPKWKRAIYAMLIAGCAAFMLLMLPRKAEPQMDAYIPDAQAIEHALIVGLPADHLLNTGDVNVLVQLPGIGTVLAERIVENREATGLFFFPEDLTTIKGIGEGKLEDIMAYFNALEAGASEPVLPAEP